MVITAVLVAFTTILWVYYLWSLRKYYALASKMPSARGLPLIGILHNVYKVSDALYKFSRYAAQLKTKTFFCWVGTHAVVYSIDPKFAEIILNSPNCLKKSVPYDALNDVIGHGLVTSGPPRWNRHRRLMNPIFNYKAIQKNFPNFNKLGHVLCEKFNALVNHGEVAVMEMVNSAILKSTLETVMGEDSNQEYDEKFLTHFESLKEMSIERVLKPWLSNSIIFRFMSMYKPFKTSQAFIIQHVREIVATKLKLINENNSTSNGTEVSVDIEKSKHIFIDEIIKIHQRNEFTLDDIIQHANTLLIAAIDTQATAIFSTLTCLAMYPKYQEILFEEIITVIPQENTDVTHEDLKNLVYLDMCINESMRLLSPFPIIGRECNKDFRVSKDILIPKGTQILIDIFNLQRDKDIWGPDATSFNPDHFLPANLVDKNKYSFIPFSKGPRNCIGWQYGTWESMVVLAQILRKYRFSTKFRFEDLIFICQGTVKFAEQPHLEIHRR